MNTLDITLIGICGKIGSGKSSVANYIIKKYNTQNVISREYILADPLKKIALIFGFPHENIYGTQSDKSKIYEPLGISTREFMQKFGTEICREYLPKILPNIVGPYNNIWINILHNSIINDFNQPIRKYAIISDVRFRDEAQYIKDNRGIIIKIIRLGQNDSHKSETDQDIIKADIIIENNGTIEELYSKIDNIFTAPFI